MGGNSNVVGGPTIHPLDPKGRKRAGRRDSSERSLALVVANPESQSEAEPAGQPSREGKLVRLPLYLSLSVFVGVAVAAVLAPGERGYVFGHRQLSVGDSDPLANGLWAGNGKGTSWQAGSGVSAILTGEPDTVDGMLYLGRQWSPDQAGWTESLEQDENLAWSDGPDAWTLPAVRSALLPGQPPPLRPERSRAISLTAPEVPPPEQVSDQPEPETGPPVARSRARPDRRPRPRQFYQASGGSSSLPAYPSDGPDPGRMR